MINNDEALIQTRHLVIEETCRLAWNDQLDEQHKEEWCLKSSRGQSRPSVDVVFIRREKLSVTECGLRAART